MLCVPLMAVERVLGVILPCAVSEKTTPLSSARFPALSQSGWRICRKLDSCGRGQSSRAEAKADRTLDGESQAMCHMLESITRVAGVIGPC